MPVAHRATEERALAVCSWSLQPATATELVGRVRETGVHAVQLALEPVRTGAMPLAELRAALSEAGITVVSGMMAMAGEDYSSLESIRRTGGIRPTATWPQNLAAARENARLARALGLDLVTFHAGFLPHDAANPERATMVARLRQLADAFANEGVALALETGQESADTLLELLRELGRSDVGVNFDPANMILYGMGDPVAALRRLAPSVRQIHVKDARGAARPGEWGTEVPVGDGGVDWASFFEVVRAEGITAGLVIEREAGTDRVADVRRARELVQRLRSARPTA